MKNKTIMALLLAAVTALPVAAADVDFPHLSTTGYGEVVAVPDMAVIQVQVEETMLSAEQAKQEVDKAVEAFITRLTTEGVERDDIAAANLYLSPQYHYPKAGKAELVGYRATRSVTVTVDDLQNLNRYLEGALGDGINTIDSIELQVKDSDKYQQLARDAAIKDAMDKAKSLAKGFEMSLDGVWRIEYHNAFQRPVKRAARMAAESMSDSYQDTAIKIRDQVNVTYKIK
ncbi:oxidative stress defense protein [Vibrio sp. SCSIO 43136]|uniref:oxidative stress defense protein n=1 Tax=Vibrio sp. SCSIO 43136 TaxID=2819101 RepID=UPI0020751B39|nr:oxidative stress defense protein [Vibrio sp. SCSIO 43136]USD65636.1 oxidative stress defense protein [Vibrio sp. SCSIO 43136]